MIRKVIIYTLLIILGLVFILEIYIRYFADYCEPYFNENNSIIHRVKNTEGQYKTDYVQSGYFRINNEGWNSYRDYFQRKTGSENKIRIAIVGHSNIEGLRVNVNKTLSIILEDNLLQQCIDAEVYTFGYGSMHIAQALHVSRYVTKTFQPDILLIGTLIAENYITNLSYNRNFFALKVDNDNTIHEVIPTQFREEKKSPLSFLYFLKSIKYADRRFKNGQLFSYVTNDKKLKCQLNYAIDLDSTNKQIPEICLDYIVQKFAEISDQNGNKRLPVFFIHFPSSVPSFNYRFDPSHKKIIHENCISILNKYNFPIIHLEKEIINDYRKNNLKYDFPKDFHYNVHAHEVIGTAISNYLLKNYFN